MLAVLLIITPIAFVGGLWLSARFFPERPNRTAARVVDLLIGAAAALAAVDLWRLARALFDDEFEGFDRSDAAVLPLLDLLFYPAALVALAAIVDFLAARASKTPRDGA